MCGEKKQLGGTLDDTAGSPPHVRGKAGRGGQNLARRGITPAYAGKSYSLRYKDMQKLDHPRVCGEKARLGRFWLSAWGSPPRVRGKVSAGKILLHDGGITPACAGKSCGWASCGGLSWDHPRVCGEKSPHIGGSRFKPGSPPRVRGKAGRLPAAPLRGRITPAYAGKR